MSKFLILDRDGTINRDTGYTYKPEELEILPGVIDGLKKFRNIGYRFIVVTNQAGLVKGKFNLEQYHYFNEKLLEHLAAEGIRVEKIYHCPHHPEITGSCECRKPKTGMIAQASLDFGLNPANCIYIGDKDSDVELGKNCKGITVLIENNRHPNNSSPDFKARDLDHAFELLASANVITIKSD